MTQPIDIITQAMKDIGTILTFTAGVPLSAVVTVF